MKYRTVMYSLQVQEFAWEVRDNIRTAQSGLGRLIERIAWSQIGVEDYSTDWAFTGFTELLIIDEADRLTLRGSWMLNDLYGEEHMGLVLIGSPGVENRLAKCQQLFSRIDTFHEYRPLTELEARMALEHYWKRLGLAVHPVDYAPEAIDQIASFARGNFRLIHRFFDHVERIMRLDHCAVVTPDVVEAAIESLVLWVL